MKNNLAVIGECMVELQKCGQHYRQGFGGDTLNTALYFSRLTQRTGNQTAYVTGVGRDGFSQNMLAAWAAEAINTELVFELPQKLPGLYAIETRDDGERSFHYWRNDSAARYWLRHISADELTQKLSTYQWIYLSGISLAILPDDCLEKLFTVLSACKKCGCHIAFDNNYRPALWENSTKAQQAYRAILSLTDMAFLTFDDEVQLYRDQHEAQAIDRTLALGVQEVVIKRGADSCIVVTPQSRHELAPQKIDNIIDTTAAGDSFSAAYLAARLNNASIPEAILAGHQLAGTVIQHRGAIIDKEFMPLLSS
ncbi:sugar kinase [Testudinibacter aquarius]|uniref:2-dehydro-3-deoxygluconokinase n=1 Tax=Testudinibacter aquarius TaxID=1524974 RepID=A0A4R3Y437_9PAST|nr:sugar kinase [Testudinibacter aquarius]KAE9528044.1 ketodeoxygluconokinase [Testudinibacter aquarius]TCV86500.1 2-keto-3-deoxygluconate kinase [Testudinibacter aquarius]TNG92651.1 sugar kinase [Testudinibacter aquarius]